MSSKPRVEGPVPEDVVRQIEAANQRIEDGRRAADLRAEIWASLWRDGQGWSYLAIGAASGVTAEQVRKSLARRSRGYEPDRARTA